MIEMNGLVQEFLAGDESHPQSKEIYVKLEKMAKDLKKAGYMPDTLEVFLNTGEEGKMPFIITVRNWLWLLD